MGRQHYAAEMFATLNANVEREFDALCMDCTEKEDIQVTNALTAAH
jgi:hypothetical protein